MLDAILLMIALAGPAKPGTVIPDPFGWYDDGLLVVGQYPPEIFPDRRRFVWCVPAKYPDLENIVLTPTQAITGKK